MFLWLEIGSNWQIKPNREVLKSIFEYFDDNNNKTKLEFHEFIKFLFLLLKGTQEDKISFIFEFIAGKNKSEFSFIDLKVFYTKVNNTVSNMYRQEAENEMARTMFQLMNISEYSKVNKEQFSQILQVQPGLLDFFDMVEIKVEKGKQLKIENYLGGRRVNCRQRLLATFGHQGPALGTHHGDQPQRGHAHQFPAPFGEVRQNLREGAYDPEQQTKPAEHRPRHAQTEERPKIQEIAEPPRIPQQLLRPETANLRKLR